MSIIYILTNQGMLDDIVKIGWTEQGSVEDRIKSLNNTSLPYPFECYYAIDVGENARIVESRVHAALDEHRINPKREFFKVDPEYAKKIISLLELMGGKDVTPREEDIVEDESDKRSIEQAKRKKRDSFNFSMIGIQPGTELQFKDNPTITCRVVDDKKVEFRGEETFLSTAASLARQDLGYADSPVAGTVYWCYGGRTLDEIRRDVGL